MSILIAHPFSRNAGYYVSDNTASGGVRIEDDIQTCKHCQRVLYKTAWLRNGGFCKGCNSPVCTFCATRMMKEGCTPYIAKVEQVVEDMLQSQRFEVSTNFHKG
jgi:hypothetical protein